MNTIKLIQCPYCLMEAIGDNWYEEDKIGIHVYLSHPEKQYRNIKACIASWKMLGLYEEKIIEEEDKWPI